MADSKRTTKTAKEIDISAEDEEWTGGRKPASFGLAFSNRCSY